MKLRSGRCLAVLCASALLAGLLAACEPAEDPVELTVTTETDGDDAEPGDGVCEMTPGLGDCSLRAAIDEANALGAASITVPAGHYRGRDSMLVTGALSINAGAPADVRLGDRWITVAEGASLTVDGVWSYGVPGARFEVHGTFVGRHLSLVGLESSGQVVVGPTGVAAVENSLLAHVFGHVAAVRNEGTVFLRNTSLLSWSDINVPTRALTNWGSATVASSILQSCFGDGPVSVGYNSDIDGTCELAAAGDQPAEPVAFTVDVSGPVTYDLPPTSPLVDAIPVGVNGCGTGVTDDLHGTPRPLDGNGDGVAGCDIGARELAPAP
ncbi:MAG: CSLREA domain-containing protein [Acidimicrobiia bacterium]|nr:CSLREA domain-containing protein [Acidimicrobiia bacterium]